MVFSSLHPLIFAVVKLLDLLVPDIHLPQLKLPVFRLFDKTLSLNIQATLREETCDLWSKHAAIRQVLDNNGWAFIFTPKSSKKARNKGKKWNNKYHMWFPLPCWEIFFFFLIFFDIGMEWRYSKYVWNQVNWKLDVIVYWVNGLNLVPYNQRWENNLKYVKVRNFRVVLWKNIFLLRLMKYRSFQILRYLVTFQWTKSWEM